MDTYFHALLSLGQIGPNSLGFLLYERVNCSRGVGYFTVFRNAIECSRTFCSFPTAHVPTHCIAKHDGERCVELVDCENAPFFTIEFK